MIQKAKSAYHMINLLGLCIAVALGNIILSSFELSDFSTKSKLLVVDSETHNSVRTPKSVKRRNY